MLFLQQTHTKGKEKEDKKMVAIKTIRCTSIVLLGLVFVIHALRDFSALAHHGKERNGNGFSASEENIVSVPKDNLDGDPAAATRKIGLGGWEMARVHKILRKETTEKELQGLTAVNGGTRQISGHFNDVSKKFIRRSQNQLNDQSKINMLEPKKTQDEAQRLLDEAAYEFVNLMHKDYKGMDRPRRKPPVNNHEPSN